MPVSAAFIQHADVWVDKAWGFMAGWNFFIFEALLIPFEITAFDLILTFWSDEIPSAAIITACIVLYGWVLPESPKRHVTEPRIRQSHQRPCREVFRRGRVLARHWQDIPCGAAVQFHLCDHVWWKSATPRLRVLELDEAGRFEAAKSGAPGSFANMLRLSIRFWSISPPEIWAVSRDS
ncbi:Amino acid/polyamine transporter I [Macrophomina phaseolina MS6]|uniref:Amino acid/polyamine transporter I n=1 Tax=Macrophomina phaseolina (strain MS6) TaxID=1126212 RepID=K2R9D4_MACPH|nr:Amino acid/polyamine transporter I [Macrophomina phaseolina MS6]